MNLFAPDDLVRDLDHLNTVIAYLLTRTDQIEIDLFAASATLSQHQHNWARDITGKPTSFTPADHTHSYAASNHAHGYQDYQWSTGGYITRTTGGPV